MLPTSKTNRPADLFAGKPSSFQAVLAEVEEFWTPLPDKPEETAEAVARALWLTAAGTPMSAERCVALALPALDEQALGRLRTLLERKRDGEPLAHLTGRQTFMGLDLLAGPSALIPRKETEILGRALAGKLDQIARERDEIRVIDLCTGCGNLALACASHEPRARVWGADLSPEAVALARLNAERCGLASRVEFREGDLFAPFQDAEFLGRCDLVSCNPPYISSSKVPGMHREISGFEPGLAFDGGTFGISVLTRFLREAPRFLKPGAWLALEIGAGQGPATARQLAKNPALAEVETRSDAGGEIRAVLARAR
ncbi:MAG TPA: HemK family protein methyltransferase [Burkholderiales bacterium]